MVKMTSYLLDSDTARAFLISQSLWLINDNIVRPCVYQIGTIYDIMRLSVYQTSTVDK